MNRNSRQASDALAMLAAEVAWRAPATIRRTARTTRIPVRLVREIRAAMDAAGFPWRAAAKANAANRSASRRAVGEG